MTKLPSQRSLINLFLIFALISFALVGVLSYHKIQELVSSNQWLLHTYKVIETVTQSQLDLKDVKADVRDYIISNDNETLKKVPALIDRIELNLLLAQQLTADNPPQQQRLVKLSSLAKQKYQFLQEAIHLQKAKEADVAKLVVSQNEQDLTVAIVRLYDEIIQNEQTLLKIRNLKVMDETYRTNIIVLVASVLTEALLLCCLILLNMNMKKRDEAEEKLQESLENVKRSNTELEQFAYIASHDLQEPLRMVVSYTQLLERRYKDKLDADASEFINYAVDGAKRMQILLVNLLLYSRVSRQETPLEVISFERIYEDTLLNLQALIEDKKAILTHTKLPMVFGDKVQLTQLLQNLIANALKFMPEDVIPKIGISATLENNEWIFAVRDNGIGIEPVYFDKIFIIFKRLHTRTEYPGTGIGLALCKKIVEKHGGRIWVASEIGKGTTFYFSLPKIKG